MGRATAAAVLPERGREGQSVNQAASSGHAWLAATRTYALVGTPGMPPLCPPGWGPRQFDMRPRWNAATQVCAGQARRQDRHSLHAACSEKHGCL